MPCLRTQNLPCLPRETGTHHPVSKLQDFDQLDLFFRNIPSLVHQQLRELLHFLLAVRARWPHPQGQVRGPQKADYLNWSPWESTRGVFHRRAISDEVVGYSRLCLLSDLLRLEEHWVSTSLGLAWGHLPRWQQTLLLSMAKVQYLSLNWEGYPSDSVGEGHTNRD